MTNFFYIQDYLARPSGRLAIPLPHKGYWLELSLGLKKKRIFFAIYRNGNRTPLILLSVGSKRSKIILHSYPDKADARLLDNFRMLINYMQWERFSFNNRTYLSEQLIAQTSVQEEGRCCFGKTFF